MKQKSLVSQLLVNSVVFVNRKLKNAVTYMNLNDYNTIQTEHRYFIHVFILFFFQEY